MLKNRIVLEYLNGIIEDEDNIPIIECLLEDMNSDEKIAEKTNIKLNIVRRILYRLYDSGLTTYKRNKDPETQWYTYFWKFDTDSVYLNLNEKYEMYVSRLEALLKFEEDNMFFACENGHMRVDYNRAADLEFICPDCGNKIVFKGNEERISDIKREIKKYKKIHKEVNNLFSN
ncbi:MAG: transcription factor E [Methanobrevibacter sp.]|jgi:transcription initiation factor TFIIE subunit alpha|nr:transcription factor E [Candidatus Methanovirga aequatorialis]